MPVSGLDHFTIITEDLAATRRFYCDLLGLTEEWRPAFDFPGAWFYAGGHPVLHIVAGRPIPGVTTGAVDHFAMRAHGDPADLARRLDEAGVRAETRVVPGTGVRQVFCKDPSGVRVELNFPAV